MPGDDDWTDYESGPFCRHWGDPSDCDEVCARCGHKCCEHPQSWDDKCQADGCGCEEWKESTNAK